MSKHLHILHLESNTPDDKVNMVATKRYNKLMRELEKEKITDYTIIPGFYNPRNIKEAISKGHHRIVQLAKEQNFEMVIIAEDDLKWTAPGAWKYFLSKIPKSFDLFFALVYEGEIRCRRVLNGFSGGMSLYAVHSRFYDTFLQQPTDTHVDRNLGTLCWKYEFYVIDKYCVTQRGGYSYNLRRDNVFYDEYLRDKKLFGQD